MLYELHLPKMAVFVLFVCLFFKIRKHSGCRRRRKWQPTPVFLPGESQGRRSLVGCCLWGRTESDMTEATQQQQQVAVALSLGRGQKADSGFRDRGWCRFPSAPAPTATSGSPKARVWGPTQLPSGHSTLSLPVRTSGLSLHCSVTLTRGGQEAPRALYTVRQAR